MTDDRDPPPSPRMVLHPPPPHPDEVTLLDYFAAAVLIAGLGISSQDIFEKASALVAESHRRRRITP